MPDSDEQLTRQNGALVRQLLEWIESAPRSYGDAMDTWRSSCPRHTIWEDAIEAGLIDCSSSDRRLRLTPAGRSVLYAAPRAG